jgi:thiosulfate dehydrogenase
MQGIPLPLNSNEMLAFTCYLKSINSGRMQRDEFDSTHLYKLKLDTLQADTANGANVYAQYCQRCHGAVGKGVLAIDDIAYTYPPLWGDSSYYAGSSMQKNILLASYIKMNMPYDKVKPGKAILTDKESVDVAVWINEHPRKIPNDLNSLFPNLKDKSKDYPYGPYLDGKTQHQHRFGPW